MCISDEVQYPALYMITLEKSKQPVHNYEPFEALLTDLSKDFACQEVYDIVISTLHSYHFTASIVS